MKVFKFSVVKKDGEAIGYSDISEQDEATIRPLLDANVKITEDRITSLALNDPKQCALVLMCFCGSKLLLQTFYAGMGLGKKIGDGKFIDYFECTEGRDKQEYLMKKIYRAEQMNLKDAIL